MPEAGQEDLAMLNDVVTLLVQQLNDYLTQSEPFEIGPRADKVVLPDGSAPEPLSFQLGAVTALLINLEEEKIPRGAEPFVRRVKVEGQTVAERIHPRIRLSLYLLFVARFRQYEDSLLYLSRVIDYFRCHRVLDHDNTPTLAPSIEKLIPELITLPFAEQNEVWNALRTTYLPSALYKVKLVAFEDAQGQPVPPILETAAIVEPYGDDPPNDPIIHTFPPKGG